MCPTENQLVKFLKSWLTGSDSRWRCTCCDFKLRVSTLQTIIMAAEPTVFDLTSGNPFTYEARAISVISGTEAFKRGINTRDKKRCVVCGERGRAVLEHAHIVPKVEEETVRSPYLLLRILTNEIRVVGRLV